MRLDRLFANYQLDCDFVIGATMGDACDHFQFARGQFIQENLARLLHFAQDASRDLGMKHTLTSCRRLHRCYQFLGTRVFEQIRKRPGLDHTEDLVVFKVRGQDNDPHAGCDALDLAHGCDAIHFRHEQIKQKYIGEVFFDQLESLLTILALAYHLDLCLLLQQEAQALSHYRVIIDDHNPDHRLSSNGTRTLRAVPTPGLLSSCKEPCSSSTRSCSKCSPRPWRRLGSSVLNPRPLSCMHSSIASPQGASASVITVA